eukprot:172856_1
MTISTLLLNVLSNIIGHKSRKQLLIVLIVFYVAIRRHFKNKQRLKSFQKIRKIEIKDEPLITFSGGGQLGFYFQGICAYLRDNFDLEGVRFAGISVGSTAAASLATRLSTEASMVFGLKWFKTVSDRPLKLFLLPPSKIINVGTSICEQFGITDEWIQRYNERTDYYFGVTNFSVFPPKHELVGDFNSRYESFYAMSCSMRVLPFFSSPGYYRKMWLLDGGFSAIFSIPKDCNPNKVIKVTPSTRIIADIQPNKYTKNTFEIIDAFKMPTLDEIYKQFENGYNDAIRCRPKLIAKGLKLKSKDMGGGYNNKLKQYMKILKKHGQNVFYDINADELRKEDFSQFLPQMSPNPKPQIEKKKK